MSEYNEANIQSNETKRIAQENERINNETIRITNEIERQAREDMRIENENNRIIKETERIIAEEERQANEQGRVNAETQRVTNEQGREGRLDNIEEEIQNVKNNYLPLSGGTMTGNIIPSTDTLSLGSDTNRWQSIYAKTEINTNTRLIVGDASSNLYMFSNSIQASQSLYLKGGAKSEGIYVDSDNSNIRPGVSSNWNLGSDVNRWRYLYISGNINISNGTNNTLVGSDAIACQTKSLWIRGGTTVRGLTVDSDSLFFGGDGNGSWNLGNSNVRWTTAYLTSNPNVSSDRTLKENIQYIRNNDNLNYTDMYNFVKNDLELTTYNFINDDKMRMSFIAQDLLCNIDGSDNKIGQMIINPEPIPTEEEIENGTPYPTLSYDMGMYISVLAGALKESINEIEKLKEEINQLKRQ